MTVYVDNARHPFGNMLMSHMIADTTEELLAMADKIGVARKWLQSPGTYREHFDVCQAKRTLAIKHGADAVSQRDVGRMIVAKRKAAVRCWSCDEPITAGAAIQFCGVVICAACDDQIQRNSFSPRPGRISATERYYREWKNGKHPEAGIVVKEKSC